MTEQRDSEIQHLIGGVLCLDFANTLYGHIDVIHEYLFDYRDLVLWSRHVGILSTQKAAVLLVKWEQVRAESEAVFHQAIELRETIFHVFASLAQGESPNPEDVITLHQAWLESQSHSKLIQTNDGFSLDWKDGDELTSLLWPIASSVVELLTSNDLKRVKQCGRCDWLFLDMSRNQKRRWCSMSACGNRVKMARRYSRIRQQGESAADS